MFTIQIIKCEEQATDFLGWILKWEAEERWESVVKGSDDDGFENN